MTSSPQFRDTTPWYRQFWPWFLILLPASVVVAAVSTLVIANRGADDLVVAEYYKDGLAINRRLEKEQAAADRELTATLAMSSSTVRLQLAGYSGTNAFELRLSHPMEADRDFTVRLSAAPQGGFSGQLMETVSPRWHWALEPLPSREWRLSGTLSSANFPP